MFTETENGQSGMFILVILFILLSTLLRGTKEVKSWRSQAALSYYKDRALCARSLAPD